MASCKTHTALLERDFRIWTPSQINLYGFCDANWGVTHEDRKSIYGYCVYLGNSLISWSSKRQNVVSRSSTKSEYIAIADVASELSWVTSLLGELKCLVPKPVIIWCDNIGASSLVVNPIYHSRTKHVEIDVHFIRTRWLLMKFKFGMFPLLNKLLIA